MNIFFIKYKKIYKNCVIVSSLVTTIKLKRTNFGYLLYRTQSEDLVSNSTSNVHIMKDDIFENHHSPESIFPYVILYAQIKLTLFVRTRDIFMTTVNLYRIDKYYGWLN